MSWILLTCAACASTPALTALAPAPVNFAMQPAIVTSKDVATEEELRKRGEKSLLEQKWQDALDDYKALLAADPTGPHAAEYTFDLAQAEEGQQDRTAARDAYLALATKYAADPNAKVALVRVATLDAFLEDWPALASVGDTILARTDIDDVERMVGLGARGLANVELRKELLAASKDINDGLDLADRHHYGAADVLPVAVAQLRFALGELRRTRSEKITFDPLPPDFVEKLEERSALLLQAQVAYAEAVRSVDPHWASMAGYRVGEMYRALHRELMQIPPPKEAKTQRQRDLFYAFMHVRYRVLLERGLIQLGQTIALADRMKDASPWIARAREAKDEMEMALADERAQLERMPFSEEEMTEAIERLKKNQAR